MSLARPPRDPSWRRRLSAARRTWPHNQQHPLCRHTRLARCAPGQLLQLGSQSRTACDVAHHRRQASWRRACSPRAGARDVMRRPILSTPCAPRFSRFSSRSRCFRQPQQHLSMFPCTTTPPPSLGTPRSSPLSNVATTRGSQTRRGASCRCPRMLRTAGVLCVEVGAHSFSCSRLHRNEAGAQRNARAPQKRAYAISRGARFHVDRLRMNISARAHT